MKKDKQQSSFVNIGSSSLLIIFLVLSLVAFAVLSLVSAHSDHKLTGRLAAHKTEYYEASSKAERILAKMDAVFIEQAEEAGDNLADYPKAVVDELLSGSFLEGVDLTYTIFERENKNVSSDKDSLLELGFTIPISEKQALKVILYINDYTQSDTYYKVQAWQIISTEKWEGSQAIQLIPMGE